MEGTDVHFRVHFKIFFFMMPQTLVSLMLVRFKCMSHSVKLSITLTGPLSQFYFSLGFVVVCKEFLQCGLEC